MRRVFLAALLGLATTSSASASTLLLGDSLAVGMAPYIHIRHLKVNARVSRSTQEGMSLLASYPHQDRLMVSLFTNNGPDASDLRILRRAIAFTKHKATCVVWATLHVGYEDMSAANRVLRRARSKWFQVVEWDRFVRRHPGLIQPDNVHPTPAGYRARAHLYVAALHRCQR